MLEHMTSPAFQSGVVWGRTLQRLAQIEERTDALEAAIGKVSADMEQARSWGRRALILLAIWGSLGLAGVNHDQASSLIAAALKLAIR